MKYLSTLAALILCLTFAVGCKKKEQANAPAAPKVVDLAALANAVPNSGPRSGNNYKMFFLVLRQNQAPAAGFPVDIYVKGKSEPKIYRTDDSGLIRVEDLPFPDAKHQLVSVLHYYKGQEDQPREIEYPYIESDGYRLKDTQYIPNTVTPNPQ